MMYSITYTFSGCDGSSARRSQQLSKTELHACWGAAFLIFSMALEAGTARKPL